MTKLDYEVDDTLEIPNFKVIPGGTELKERTISQVVDTVSTKPSVDYEDEEEEDSEDASKNCMRVLSGLVIMCIVLGFCKPNPCFSVSCGKLVEMSPEEAGSDEMTMDMSGFQENWVQYLGENCPETLSENDKALLEQINKDKTEEKTPK